MGVLVNIYLSTLCSALTIVCTTEEDIILQPQQEMQLEDTSARDTQRILLGVIILELIIIIILLNICKKINAPKPCSEDTISHASHILPTFNTSTFSNINKRSASHISDQEGSSSNDDRQYTSSRNPITSTKTTRRHKDNEEDFLLQEDLEFNRSEQSAFRDLSSTELPLGRISMDGTGDTTVTCFNTGSEVTTSQTSKLKLKVLPRDFML